MSRSKAAFCSLSFAMPPVKVIRPLAATAIQKPACAHNCSTQAAAPWVTKNREGKKLNFLTDGCNFPTLTMTDV